MCAQQDGASDPPCPGCGAKSYDRGRFFFVYRLCRWCFEDAEARDAAAYRYRVHLKPPPERPRPPFPTQYPPGHPLREPVIQERLEKGYALFHPDDATWEEWREAEAEADDEPFMPPPPRRERTYQKKGATGVEFSKGRYRARPFWDGYKHNAGAFARESEAVAAVEKFWRDRLGLFAAFRDQTRFWGYRPPVVVLRLADRRTRVPLFAYHLAALETRFPGLRAKALIRTLLPILSRCKTPRGVFAVLAREARRAVPPGPGRTGRRQAAWAFALFPPGPVARPRRAG